MSSGVSFANLFGHKGNPHDVVKTPESSTNIEETDDTGIYRLRKIFYIDPYGYKSKELSMITQLSSLSFFGSFIFGGVIRSRDAFADFIKNNTATKFESHFDAKRQIQRIVILSFVSGGWRWGWRIGAFSLTFTTLLTSVSIYRKKESLVEYIVAGGTTGGLFRLSLGLKGVIAGSVAGAALGTVAGSLSIMILKISGLTMADMRDFSKAMSDHRQDAIIEGRRQKSAANRDDNE